MREKGISKIVPLQGLQENGVEKLKPLGQQFDPNLHEALFEMPSPDQKAGTVGAVTKVSYTCPYALHMTANDLIWHPYTFHTSQCVLIKECFLRRLDRSILSKALIWCLLGS